jgi:hypothetical protein
MEASLQQLVWERANGTCEYCRIPAAICKVPFQIDHIIARKHGGRTTADNLALACFFCNSYKGTNVSGIDPHSSATVRLFHPRSDTWQDHFWWDGPWLVGRTPIGRSTIATLAINRMEYVLVRQSIIAEGGFQSR